MIIDGREYVHCPVCGTAATAVYDICDVFVSGKIQEKTNIDGGPNEMTFQEAKEAYTKGIPII